MNPKITKKGKVRITLTEDQFRLLDGRIQPPHGWMTSAESKLWYGFGQVHVALAASRG